MSAIYLPIEIKTRELEARLLTAAHLVKMGFCVVIGQQWGLFANHNRISPGVMVFKTTNRIQAEVMQGFKQAGHKVAALDEECLCCADTPCFLEGFDPLAAHHCDLFLAQSELHKEAILSKYPQLNVEIGGNPRAEINPEDYSEEAKSIKDQYGEFILFNTNFASINSHWPAKKLEEISAWVGLSKEEHAARLKWEATNLDAFELLLDWWIYNRDSKIVLRIHPGEQHEYWEGKYGDKISIIRRSAPQPWILASQCVVHTRCTTGLEAALLRVPGLNLEPEEHPSARTLINEINPPVRTVTEAIRNLTAWIDHKAGPLADSIPDLTKYFPGGDSARRMAGHIARLADDKWPVKFSGYIRGTRADVQKEKCTIEPDEFLEKFQAACDKVGVKHTPQCGPLDESLFVVMP